MRKSLWLLLIISLLIISFACKKETATVEDEPDFEEMEIPHLPLDAHMTRAYHDDLSGLIKQKYIRVLTTFNRTNFFISEGRLVGYEYAMLKDYEKYLNRQIKKDKLKVVFEFIPVERDELLPKLVEGYGDIAAAALTVTDERKRKVDFTQPYLTGINEIVVTGKNKTDIRTLDDLSGEKVYVRKSSSYYQSLAMLNKIFKVTHRAPVDIKPLSEELETEAILEMVDSGAIAITVSDSNIARVWSNVLKNIVLHEDIVLRKGANIAWAVRKSAPELRASLNAFLDTHKKGTHLGNIYFNRYFKKTDKLKNPAKIDDWKKVKKYKEVIQKYADQYDFEWIFILAVAFQESGLDPSRKSHAGAVGLMQVLPSTARCKVVGIKDISTVENNVHAGVKYLAFLRDNYFNDKNIRTRDRIRLALASYNAGPGNIEKARDLAEKMGLDRNRWFRNVEIAMLRIVGQETVRYVSNINKYYVLYQTFLEQEKEVMALEKRGHGPQN